MPTKFRWTSIDNNSAGHPRYVVHFLQLLTDAEKDALSQEYDLERAYRLALNRARPLGGSRFSNKQYGGGIAFVSYNLQETEQYILEALNDPH